MTHSLKTLEEVVEILQRALRAAGADRELQSKIIASLRTAERFSNPVNLGLCWDGLSGVAAGQKETKKKEKKMEDADFQKALSDWQKDIGL